MLVPRCKKHPKYQAKLQPKVPCLTCWTLYFAFFRKKPEIDLLWKEIDDNITD